MGTGARRMVAATLAALLAGGAAASAGEAARFVVIGDLPYNEREAARLPGEVGPAIRTGDFPFVIHVGDLKGGGESCTNERLRTAHRTVMDLLPGRVFFTPGDNDWTDCDRTYLSEPRSELERLAFLRGLFFRTMPALPAGWGYRRQPDYPENAIWQHRGVQFATLHVVGTNNGRDEILLDDAAVALDAVDRRDAANIDWLRRVFEAARQSAASAVVVAMQADMGRVKYRAPCDARERRKCDGFARIRAALAGAAAEFAGPVLLVHGDSSPFCLDRGYGGERAPQLWRLNSAGDGIFDAAVVTVDPADREAPFKVRRLLPGEDVRRVC